MMSVLLGSSLVAALFSISADITERMSQEMRSYGANILVTPKSEDLHEDVQNLSTLRALCRSANAPGRRGGKRARARGC